MKILKIFGVVAGIHVLFLIAIFANPGCSSATKPPPAPSDTAARAEAAPSLSLPAAATTAAMPPPADAGFAPAPIAFDPNAPATSSSGGSGSGSLRTVPTRPNTPAAGAVLVEPVQDVQPATTYTVVSGDNLWNLAKKWHLSTTELAAANNLKTNAVLHPGQKLLIPGKAVTGSTASAVSVPASGTAKVPANGAANGNISLTTTASKDGDVVKYTVKSGETLSQIAKQFGVSQRELGVKNHITDPAKLQAGTELIIPGWTAANGKAGKAPAKGDAKKSAPPTLNVEDPLPAKQDAPLLDSPFSPAPKK